MVWLGWYTGEDIRQCERGVHVVSGTPGRVFDMIKRRSLRTRSIKTLVLDEADEMLAKGFKEQIYEVYRYLPPDTQVQPASIIVISITPTFWSNQKLAACNAALKVQLFGRHISPVAEKRCSHVQINLPTLPNICEVASGVVCAFGGLSKLCQIKATACWQDAGTVLCWCACSCNDWWEASTTARSSQCPDAPCVHCSGHGPEPSLAAGSRQ